MARTTEYPDQLAAMPDPMVPRFVQVLGRAEEASGIVTLELEPPHGDGSFEPGQFNMLYAMGVGECAISLSGDPGPGPVHHTIREVGATTRALTALKPGVMVGVRGPFGSAWPLEEAQGRDILVMAGGLGLVPLLPALHVLARQRENYGRFAILYGARSPADILFARQLELWGSEAGAEVQITVDHAAQDWAGPIGVVTRLLRPDMFDPANMLAMVCGPEVMMRFSANALLDQGVSADAVYLSMERNMKCAIGHCGHCQFGPTFICRDGAVFSYDKLRPFLGLREI